MQSGRSVDTITKVVLQSLGFVVLGCCLSAQSVWAQPGAGTYRAEVGATGALETGVPFWLHANQYGLIDPGSAGAYTRLAARREQPRGQRLAYSAGVDLVARASAHSTLHLREAYVQARAGFLRAYAGRKRETVGTVATGGLSSGELGTSPNATPVPKIAIATTGYTDVPFARGHVEVKGAWSEGWLGDARYVDRAFLHQKTAYVRLGGDLPVRLYGGLVHNGLWGGTSPKHGALPASFGDYLRTVVALNGGEDAPVGERSYIQGNHLGLYDVGIEVDIGGIELLAYRHFIYEDRDNLKLKSPQDGLLGLSVRWASGRLVHRMTYEHLYTKWQNGPVGPGGPGRGGHGGRDNYYNHYIYRSGWTYHGRTLGSPLLTPAPDTKSGSRGVMNNRVVGHHVGLEGPLGGAARYRVLATYTRNYGLYEAPFDGERRDQWSLLLEARGPVSAQYGLDLVAAVALDRGALYSDNLGVRVGLVRRGTW